MMRGLLTSFSMMAVLLATGAAARPITPLAQAPTMNGTEIVFTWAGYLWRAPRSGGLATRLTTNGHEGRAFFSPDGRWIAYGSEVDGNHDVYVIPAEGGQPRRLTDHPGDDEPVGWSPDSQRVLFTTTRDSYVNFQRLYTVPVSGGWQTPLPMWRGVEGAFSPDAKQIAYVPNNKWQKEWKRYRGGQATPIWLARLDNLHIEKVPRDGSNDSEPVWLDDKVYFLSDRDGPVSLFAYDTVGKSVRRLIDNKGFDLKTLSAGPGGLIYEQFGSVHIYSPASGADQEVSIQVDQDVAAALPHKVDAADDIETVALDPKGERVAVEARGDIFTLPVGGPGFERLTRTSNAHERDPAWSPDGEQLAYLSDASGEYELRIAAAKGEGPARSIRVGERPTFLSEPRWSPDGRTILVDDAWNNLWRVDVASGASRIVDWRAASTAWSPDGQWLAYSKPMASGMHAVWLYSLASGEKTQLTNALADARWPVFDKGGRLLEFAVSTDLGLSLTIQDMSGMNHPITRTIWAAVLRQDDDSALALGGEPAVETTRFRIDLPGLDRRIAALPVPPANYSGLHAGRAGQLYLEQLPIIQPRSLGRVGITVSRFELKSGQIEVIGSRLARFSLSADGGTALYAMRGGWHVADASGRLDASGKALASAGLNIEVDPRAEWREMFQEAWRYERDFFYDPNLHGLNLDAVVQKYEPFVDRVGDRNDVIYLFREMLGDLTVGHMAVDSFTFHPPNGRRGGLLGADYAVENGRYRFSRIYDAESWNPGLDAPLARVGAGVKAGDYLLAVNDKPLDPKTDLYAAFEDTAGKSTRITVGADPGGRGARTLVVKPINDETELRGRAWEEDNRRRVERLSGGRIAYVHVPDTADDGFANFNRFYFAQVGKEAAIIDGRFNTGGRFADYIIDMLSRPLRNCAVTRASGSYCVPAAQIYGPKTMITNEMSGSGGDSLPWMFKTAHVGALVGTRTWGGLVGGSGPTLLDGMGIATPFHGHYGLSGSWEVENHGVTPDQEVENDPASVAAGHDPQLERAVTVTLEALREHPVVEPSAPPYPRYARP